jgi:lactoylglutathione lyase
MTTETNPIRARALGINHVALEVGDIDAALRFYGRIFAFELRSRSETQAFIDLGDQFLALQKTEGAGPDRGRYFGLVVDGREPVRAALEAAGVELIAMCGLNFRDPWGNRVEVVPYVDVQFSKTPEMLASMGLAELEKTAAARAELAKRGVETV